MNYVIARVIEHGPTVKEFHVKREDGGKLADWQPGSHIVLCFSGANGKIFENSYSLIGLPEQSEVYRIAVQREALGKGGSRSLHDEMKVGSLVNVSGPFNSFPLIVDLSSGPRVLLIAGGIGITPLVSMAYALGKAGVSFELHYLARNPDRIVLIDELRAIPHASVILHMSQDSGRMDLTQLLGQYTAANTFYACGPVALLQDLAETGTNLGWPATSMHFESFGARAQSSDTSLTVELNLSQITLEVVPGTSILDTLIAAGVFVSYDCKVGECASCYTQVLEGQPIHRDVCLTVEMREMGMCTCVSWARPGRLVLAM